MIVRNSGAPRGIDVGPAAAWSTDGEPMGGTFVRPLDGPEEDPSIIRRREQWKAAQQRRRDKVAGRP